MKPIIFFAILSLPAMASEEREFEYALNASPFYQQADIDYQLDLGQNGVVNASLRGMESNGLRVGVYAGDGSNYYRGSVAIGLPDSGDLPVKSKSYVNGNIAMGHYFEPQGRWADQVEIGLGVNYTHMAFARENSKGSGSQNGYELILDSNIDTHLAGKWWLRSELDTVLFGHNSLRDKINSNNNAQSYDIKASSLQYGLDAKISIEYRMTDFSLQAGMSKGFRRSYGESDAVIKGLGDTYTGELTSHNSQQTQYFLNMKYLF